MRWDAGEPVSRLARRYGVSDGVIHRWARDLGLPARACKVRKKASDIPRTLRDDWNGPDTLADLAAKYGVHADTIVRWAGLLGLPPRKPPRRTRVVPDGFRDDWFGPVPLPHLVEKYGVSPKSMTAWAKKIGLGPRGRRPMAQPIPDDFGENWLGGRPVAELADLYGVSDFTIGRWSRVLGLPRRPRGGSRAKYQVPGDFPDRWLKATSVRGLATAYAVNSWTIRAWARRSGLPSIPGGVKRRRSAPPAPAVEKKPVRRVTAVAPTEGAQTASAAVSGPDIPAGLAADILASGGRFAALSVVCDTHGISSVRAQQLWHRLRGLSG